MLDISSVDSGTIELSIFRGGSDKISHISVSTVGTELVIKDSNFSNYDGASIYVEAALSLVVLNISISGKPLKIGFHSNDFMLSDSVFEVTGASPSPNPSGISIYDCSTVVIQQSRFRNSKGMWGGAITVTAETVETDIEVSFVKRIN